MFGLISRLNAADQSLHAQRPRQAVYLEQSVMAQQGMRGHTAVTVAQCSGDVMQKRVISRGMK